VELSIDLAETFDVDARVRDRRYGLGERAWAVTS
jgi:hypothetical protein